MTLEGVLIIFTNPGASPGQANLLRQKLYGQQTTTRGRVYHRRGLLEDLPHWRIKRGVMVVRKEDREQVVELLGSFVKEIHWWEVKLRPSEARRLRLQG